MNDSSSKSDGSSASLLSTSTSAMSEGDAMEIAARGPEWRSATVVKLFLRFAISSICHRRKILPESSFVFRNFCGLEKKLPFIDAVDDEGNITHPEGYKVSQWLEHSIFKALDMQYIEKLLVIILHENHEVELPEIFIFNFHYGRAENSLVKRALPTQIKSVTKSLIEVLNSTSSSISLAKPRRASLTFAIEYTSCTPDYFSVEYFSFPSPLPLISFDCSKVRHIKDVEKHRNIEKYEDPEGSTGSRPSATFLGDFSTQYHTSSVSHQTSIEMTSKMKAKLFGTEENISRTKNVPNFESFSVIQCEQNNKRKREVTANTWGTKNCPSFPIPSSKTVGMSPYPIYSPLPPTKLHARTSRSPKGSNGKSPCWSETTTIILTSVGTNRENSRIKADV